MYIVKNYTVDEVRENYLVDYTVEPINLDPISPDNYLMMYRYY